MQREDSCSFDTPETFNTLANLLDSRKEDQDPTGLLASRYDVRYHRAYELCSRVSLTEDTRGYSTFEWPYLKVDPVGASNRLEGLYAIIREALGPVLRLEFPFFIFVHSLEPF